MTIALLNVVTVLVSYVFQIRVFAIARIFLRRSIGQDDRSVVDPSKFLPLSFLTAGLRGSAGFLDICEPPHVWMSRRDGAANRERRAVRANCTRAEQRKWVSCTWMSQVKIHLVYADLLRVNANARTCEKRASRRAEPSRAHVIIAAAYVQVRIFRPRIPFFRILAKVALADPVLTCILHTVAVMTRRRQKSDLCCFPEKHF